METVRELRQGLFTATVWVLILFLGGNGYFIKRLVDHIDSVDANIVELKIQVAVIQQQLPPKVSLFNHHRRDDLQE